jgi:geranylgeranyl pyrophosphate synthase
MERLEMNFTEFVRKTKDDVEETLRGRVIGQDNEGPLLRILEGGKRLRPLLCVLSFRACGGRDEDYTDVLDVAAAVEVGHCASLCHDDIIDRDLRRRKGPSLWVEKGIPEALIVGHQAISLGLWISLIHGREIAETFLEAWRSSLRGGMEEMKARRSKKLTTAEYLHIIREKTASLFSGAAKAGSQIAGAPGELQKLMEKYGAAMGVAYQIADDLSELGRKKSGELLLLIERSSKSETAISLQELLSKEMNAAIVEAEKLSRDARIPESEFKPLLGQAPRYFIEQLLK